MDHRCKEAATRSRTHHGDEASVSEAKKKVPNSCKISRREQSYRRGGALWEHDKRCHAKLSANTHDPLMLSVAVDAIALLWPRRISCAPPTTLGDDARKSAGI